MARWTIKPSTTFWFLKSRKEIETPLRRRMDNSLNYHGIGLAHINIILEIIF